MLIDVAAMQRYMPARIKFFLKRYYRTFFPNRLMIVFSPTFRCNYRCSYCPVVTKFDFTTVFPRKEERSASEWLQAFDKLRPAMVYIAGGEPFVYAGLAEFINGLPAKHQLTGLVTNLSQDVRLYRKVKRKLHINASFHREFIQEDEFLEKIKDLRGQFHIHVNIVATPENLPLIEQISQNMSRDGVTLHVDPYVDLNFKYSPEQRALLERCVGKDRNPDKQLDYNDFSEKSCSAGRNYINIEPNGDVFACAGGMGYLRSGLYSGFPNPRGMDLNQFALGNIFDPAFTLNQTDIKCSLPCKEACDRDSVVIQRIQSARTSPQSNALPVIR